MNTVNPNKFTAKNDDEQVNVIIVIIGGLQYQQWKRVADQEGKKHKKNVKNKNPSWMQQQMAETHQNSLHHTQLLNNIIQLISGTQLST